MGMSVARLARRALPVAGAAAALALTATAALADDRGPRTAGQHVHDLAGALTPARVTDLEQSAAALDLAGAPTVVYLRRKDAGGATTRQDARAPMDAWAVESAPGRMDGFGGSFPGGGGFTGGDSGASSGSGSGGGSS
jgi:uncharacterized membrane protein YgcG